MHPDRLSYRGAMPGGHPLQVLEERRENGAMRLARDAYGPTPGPASRRGSRPLMAGRSLNGQGMTG
jgi:hypothetical protein